MMQNIDEITSMINSAMKSQNDLIAELRDQIDILEKYKDKYIEYKLKYEQLLVYGVSKNNENLKRINHGC